MDWSSVILAGLGAGIGAGLGSLLISVLWPWRPLAEGETRKLDMRLIALIAAVIGGTNLGPPLIEPVVGPYIRDWLDGGSFDAEVAEMMEQEPFFQVLQDKAPERAQAWREAVATAYREGGGAEAERVGRAEGEVVGAWMVTEFSPRASDETLVGFYAAIASITRDTLMDHPHACYGFFFPGTPGAVSAPTLEAVGVDPMLIAGPMIELARTASDEPVPIDREAGQAGQMAAVTAMSEAIGAENIALIGGRAPANDAEFTLACQGMLAFIDDIAASDDAANTFRMMAAAG